MHDFPIFPILAFWAVTGGIVFAAKAASRTKLANDAEEEETDLLTGLVHSYLPPKFGAKLVGKKKSEKNSKSKKRQRESDAGDSGKQNNDAAKVTSCQQFMQCAIDQKAQAETAASRTSSGTRDSRLSAASQAQYHADAARNWADKAAGTAYGASQLAQDAVARARDAASRAQEAANRARYNAETFRH